MAHYLLRCPALGTCRKVLRERVENERREKADLVAEKASARSGNIIDVVGIDKKKLKFVKVDPGLSECVGSSSCARDHAGLDLGVIEARPGAVIDFARGSIAPQTSSCLKVGGPVLGVPSVLRA